MLYYNAVPFNEIRIGNSKEINRLKLLYYNAAPFK
jgi:hypothetical protein